MKCPDCGSRLVGLKCNGRYECRNEKCPVIEVRVSRRKGTQILRDSVLASRAAKSGRRRKR